MSEAAFQRQIVELAEILGWRWLHVPTVTVRRKQRDGSERTYAETATKGPLGKGWCDLLLLRERLVTIEVKGPGGRLSDDQLRVREWLRDAEVEHYTVWPTDWDQVVDVLTRRHR